MVGKYESGKVAVEGLFLTGIKKARRVAGLFKIYREINNLKNAESV